MPSRERERERERDSIFLCTYVLDPKAVDLEEARVASRAQEAAPVPGRGVASGGGHWIFCFDERMSKLS